MHTWGCGTNCANLSIYEISGNTIFGTTASGIDISKSGIYFATFPTTLSADENDITIYETKNLSIIFQKNIGKDKLIVSDFEFTDDKYAKIALEDEDGKISTEKIKIIY